MTRKKKTSMSKLYLFTKKIHRLLVLIIFALGLLMTVTGTLLRYPGFAVKYFSFFDPVFIRFIHRNLSTYFSVVLAAMMLTGLWMYLYPYLTRHKKEPPQNLPPQGPVVS